MARLSAIITLCLLLTACVVRERIITPYVPPLERPQLAYIGPDDLKCLSDSAFDSLDQNERGLIEYAEQLEAVLQTIRELGR